MPKHKSSERITLDVSPSWWTAVYRKRDGALPLAIKLAVDGVPILLELHADDSALTLVVPRNQVTDYAELARAIRNRIESKVTLDASDRIPDAKTKERISRKQFEKELRKLGMKPASDAPHVWAVTGVSVYVRLSKTDDDNQASVETNDGRGPQPYTYGAALAALEKFAEDAGKATDAEMGGEIDSVDGDEPGGILRAR